MERWNKNTYFPRCPSSVQCPQQTSPTHYEPPRSWVRQNPSPNKFQAATTNQSGLAHDVNSPSVYSPCPQGTNTWAAKQIKRQISSKMVLWRHTLDAQHRLSSCQILLRSVNTASLWVGQHREAPPIMGLKSVRWLPFLPWTPVLRPCFNTAGNLAHGPRSRQGETHLCIVDAQ